MKNKYQRMSKEEKQIVLNKYKSTDKGKEMVNRLNRVLMIGITGIILGSGLIVYAYLNNESIWNYISASVLLVVSIFFIFKSKQIRIEVLNKEALKK